MKQLRTLDQAYIKRHNIERMITMLERCQPVSRTELARLTEMSSASVTRFVTALNALGLVKEVSVMDSAGRGRKAVNLCTAPDGMFSLGCHVDPRSLRILEELTHSKLAILDKSGKIATVGHFTGDDQGRWFSNMIWSPRYQNSLLLRQEV